MRRFVPVILGIALLTVAALPQAEAMPVPFPLFVKPCEDDVGDLESKLSMLKNEKSKHLTNAQRMREELSRADNEQRQPDVKKLRDWLADAGGKRSKAYHERPPYIQGLVDHFEGGYQPYNWIDSVDLFQMAVRKGAARAFYQNEIERSERFIGQLDAEADRINGCLILHQAKRNDDQPGCPRDAIAGGYLVACDPGMGGEPPFISDAGQQPFTGGIPPGTPTSGATGGEVVEQPGLKPPPAGAGGTGTPGQQPPQQGIVCYSEKTQEYYIIQYGPCPPPWMKPPTGTTTAGEPPRVPWQGLVPPEGKPPMDPKPPMGPKPPPGGGGCGPATSCTCAGGGMGHIPCDKSKGACHCGAG